MAVYRQLILSAGGGIILARQQAEQTRNTATVLIGLGGTGLDCIRTIKTRVYERLLSDNRQDIKPTYQHIRFLGVDSCSYNQECADAVRTLDETEFFSIANSDTARMLTDKRFLATRDEFNWLGNDGIHVPHLDNAGAGGTRQVGRFMMMNRSADFMARITREISEAKRGLQNPSVYVHIFTGLSGVTGSGCFLDVCYMVRDVALELGGGINVLGYFFLPDINLSRIPASNTSARQCVHVNGYASMQELDFCMNLQHNGGAFTQEYQGHRMVKWDRPPVDTAYLIGATNTNGEVIDNAYDYAMNVTAEYVMDFLTHDMSGIGLASQTTNFQKEVRIAYDGKPIGSNLSYCAFGASCASLPPKQINTYLASEFFARFADALVGNTPTRDDVDALARAAICQWGYDNLYSSLFEEIRDGAGNSYARYQDDWRYVRNYGNRDLVESYVKQTAAKARVVKRNARRLKGDSNERSLLSRTSAALSEIIRDLQRGPFFAHQLLDTAQNYSLLNVVDDLIEKNDRLWKQEGAQTLRLRNYEGAKDDFERRRWRFLFDSDQKRFDDYEHCLRMLEEHKYLMTVYQQLDGVLREYRMQLEDSAAGYYLRLARVTQNLIETFAENRNALASESVLAGGDDFAEPLMTIAELKKAMDAEIEHINMEGMLGSFMALLLDNPEAWLQEDEGKICRLVTDFFVRTALRDVTRRSITAFLKDKYQTTTDEQLANKIYQDWIVRLADKAAPLFYFDHGVMSTAPEPSRLACISVPMASGPIKAAAQRMQSIDSRWQVKGSAFSNQICVIKTLAPVSACSYIGISSWKQTYKARSYDGLHSYEGNVSCQMPFNDWRNLQTITSESQQSPSREQAPDDYQSVRLAVERGQQLFDRGCEIGFIDSSFTIHELDDSYIDRVNYNIEQAKQLLSDTASSVSECRQILAIIETIKMPITIPTKYRVSDYSNSDSTQNYRLLAKARFVSAPALQSIVAHNLSIYEELRERLDDTEASLKRRIGAMTDS